MPKKQQMTQVSNEFVFGEKGGKGRNISSFLKNLSLSPTSNSYSETNSQIYGSLSYSKNPESTRRSTSLSRNLSPQSSRSASVGPTNNSFMQLPLTGQKSGSKSVKLHPIQRKLQYTDLDDDWDANFEQPNDLIANESADLSYTNTAPIQLMPIDSLYPDLTIIPPEIPTVNREKTTDLEDMKLNLEMSKLHQKTTKFNKFKTVLSTGSNINLQELRKLSWNGIPSELRALSWQLLLGYLPTNKSRQSAILKMKRQEYLDGIETMKQSIDFNDDSVNMTREKQIYHQIKIDVKRTNPTVSLYGHKKVQISLRKILYFWSIRHPASGYVQGINDLVTPFFQIFLSNYIWQLQSIQKFGKTSDKLDDYSNLFIPNIIDVEDPFDKSLLNDPNLQSYTIHTIDPDLLSYRILGIIEADSYWCLSRVLETITDNYIHQQPGIIKQVNELKNLIGKIDLELIQHFDAENIEFLQFAFRWMNCLLMRELSIDLIIRMWDTYLSENPLGFSNFHVYVCAAFLIKFSGDLKGKDFQEIILFLQNPPTSGWTEKDVELMLSEAFIWQSLYKNSAHLR